MATLKVLLGFCTAISQAVDPDQVTRAIEHLKNNRDIEYYAGNVSLYGAMEKLKSMKQHATRGVQLAETHPRDPSIRSDIEHILAKVQQEYVAGRRYVASAKTWRKAGDTANEVMKEVKQISGFFDHVATIYVSSIALEHLVAKCKPVQEVAQCVQEAEADAAAVAEGKLSEMREEAEEKAEEAEDEDGEEDDEDGEGEGGDEEAGEAGEATEGAEGAGEAEGIFGILGDTYPSNPPHNDD